MNILSFLRSFTIFDYAIFDLLISFVGIYLISDILSKLFLKIKIYIPKENFIFLTLPLGIVFHILFRNFTPMTLDFLNPNDFYFLKILIILLLILGLRNVNIIKS